VALEEPQVSVEQQMLARRVRRACSPRQEASLRAVQQAASLQLVRQARQGLLATLDWKK
jgi:hypothetical protein